MINDSQPPGFDVSSYTIEEINSITSEYTLKNTVSLSDHFWSKWILRNTVDASDLQTNCALIIITFSQVHLLTFIFTSVPSGYFCCSRLPHYGEDCLHLGPGGVHLELQARSVQQCQVCGVPDTSGC